LLSVHNLLHMTKHWAYYHQHEVTKQQVLT